MKFTGMSRPIDELGRIVIPKEIRNMLDISPKDLLEIYIDNNMIILKKNETKCKLCGNEHDLVQLDSGYICSDCINKIKGISE